MPSPETSHRLCRLCREEADLQVSHIVPRFHKRNLRKEAALKGGLSIVRHGKEIRDQHLTGRSEFMLCKKCEGRFGKWETYAANWFYNGRSKILRKVPSGILYEGIDYEQFRLYCLSLLWRMAESRLDYFGSVTLLPPELDRLRTALLHGATLDDDYPVCFALITRPDGSRQPISMPPSRDGDGSKSSIHLLANGFLHNFWISGYEADPTIMANCLGRDGLLAVPTIPLCDYQPFQDQVRAASQGTRKG